MSSADDEFLVLHEIVKAAKQNLSPEIWDYLIGGAETFPKDAEARKRMSKPMRAPWSLA